MIGLMLAVAAHGAEVDVVVRERADGDPVSGAVVAADGVEAITDDSGQAVLDLPEGEVNLVVSAEGYAEQIVTALPGRTVRVWLLPGEASFEIVVEGLKPTSHATRYVVDGEQAMETPGTLDDAIRLVQSLPGVTGQREYSPTSGDLSVRGSGSGDNRYYLDGIEIPYLYHFNQYASVFPASQIQTLELFPSTFSSQYGDAVGGVVEAVSRLERPEAVHGNASLNFVMAGADVRAPLNDDWWVGASGRRSYQDLAGEQTPQFTVWPVFHDFVVRAEHGDRDNGTGLFAFGAGDGYTRATGELDVLDPVEAARTPSLSYGENYEVVGVRRHWGGDRPSEGRFTLALVHHRRQAELLPGEGAEDLETNTLSNRMDYSVDPEGLLQIDFGWEAILDFTSLSVTPAGVDSVRIAEEAPAIARGAAVDDEQITRGRGGVYSTVHAVAGPVRLMPGVRVSGDTTGGGVRPEPRAAVRWRPGSQTALKLSGGHYTQRPDTELLFAGTGSPDLPTTTSWQAAAGWEQTVSNRLELGLEAYRKWLEQPLFLPIDGPPIVQDSGDALGLELITRYRMRELFFLWGWVAVQQTRVTDTDGVTRPADGDQALSGGIVLSWDIERTNVGLRYRYASGLPFTPIDGSIYDAGRDRWIPVPGRENSARLPDYHKVDLRVAHRLEFRGWDLTLSAELWLVPKASAQLYPTWNYDYSEQGWVLGPTVLPLLGARARF